MAKVVTLTPNPALDIATSVEKLLPSHKLRCGPVRRDPGGGGINVARVIHRLGGKVVAVYSCGGGSGDELRDLLRREGLLHRAVHVAGHTRESFNITEDASGSQFRFILPGDPMTEGEAKRCIDVAVSLVASGDYVVGSGSLPPGPPVDFYARFIRAAVAKGAKSVIDTQGASLRAVLEAGVDVLKASAREMGEYLGVEPKEAGAWPHACRELVKSGKAGLIAVTLGKDGAVLINGSRAWHAAVPTVTSTTTVGAGDSFLGGLLTKLVEHQDLADALRYAASAGTAALFTHGTGLCDPAEVEKLYAATSVKEL
ncbi:MAG TPA: 1-phosphofructokinase family hexose kinase [Rhizomicrobium sp.]|nr:1-phosphofructokinase family hexose kinase [Rhizomicrobium sp.]